MKSPRTSIVVLILMAMSSLVLAEELSEGGEFPRPLTLTLYAENDGGWVKPNDNNDRHYTNGLGASLAGQPDWADDIADLVGGGDGAAGIIFGQLMFTPQVIERRVPDPEDHPYAGYIFAGVYFQRDNGDRIHEKRATTLDHLQFDLGYVGPESGAEDAQVRFHETIGADTPRGWKHQLDDEVTGQITYRRKWRIDTYGLPDGIESLREMPLDLQGQVIPDAGVALGTVYRHLEAGATFRTGWNLPDDFGAGHLLDPAAATGATQRVGTFSFYGFARVAGRAVEHNLFLEGNTFRNSAGVNAEPLVGELRVGAAAAWQICERVLLGVNYSQTYLTHQFEGQEEADSYGSLAALITCSF